MSLINTSELKNWGLASKTKPITAKHLSSLLVDSSIVSKFLVSTIEGNEPLGDNVMICIGVANDAWQQTPDKLLKKYNIVEINKDGWMICHPKPENVVDYVQIFENFHIIGLWGATIGDIKCVQTGVAGDYICRNTTDHADVWIVKRSIFENTYEKL